VFTEIAWGFIEKISAAIIEVKPYAEKLLYALITINIAWIGIETILGKNDLAKIIEKVFLMGVTVLLVTRFVEISHIFLASVVKLAGISTGMDKSLLEDPTQIFAFAHTHILTPYVNAVEEVTNANSSGNPLVIVANFFQNLPFTIMFGLFTMCIYICFAIIVVQIMLNYILYHINLFFGVILLPFTSFKPFEFIGKNVFKAIFTQALTCAVIVFIASIGLRVFEGYFTSAIVRLHIDRGLSLGNLWVVIASVILYTFLCLMSPTIIMNIISGAPTMGASGLISTVAAIGGAIAGIGASQSRGSDAPVNNTANTSANPDTGGQTSTAQAPSNFNSASSSSSTGAVANDFSKSQDQPGPSAAGQFLPSAGTASSSAHISGGSSSGGGAPAGGKAPVSKAASSGGGGGG
jgi:type IV secretion system protein TrbL